MDYNAALHPLLAQKMKSTARRVSIAKVENHLPLFATSQTSSHSLFYLFMFYIIYFFSKLNECDFLETFLIFLLYQRNILYEF